MTEKILSRREREKMWQRQQILDAAIELFSQKGYQNVCMHEIAEKSEFAIGTLYKFFQNKEHLYKELLRENTEIFHEAIMRAIEEPEDVIEKLRNFVRTKGELFRKNIPFLRLFLAENREVCHSMRANLIGEMREKYLITLDALAAIFDKGIKTKQFNKIGDPYHLAVALDNVDNAFFFLSLEEPERHPYPENPDAILDIFFKGLINP